MALTHLNIAVPHITVTTDTTLTKESGGVVLVDATSNNVTLTLPDASSKNIAGMVLEVKKIDSSANTVTISGGTIDGASSLVISSQYSSYTIIADSNSGNWFII